MLNELKCNAQLQTRFLGIMVCGAYCWTGFLATYTNKKLSVYWLLWHYGCYYSALADGQIFEKCIFARLECRVVLHGTPNPAWAKLSLACYNVDEIHTLRVIVRLSVKLDISIPRGGVKNICYINIGSDRPVAWTVSVHYFSCNWPISNFSLALNIKSKLQ